jgi:hypothetical protein
VAGDEGPTVVCRLIRFPYRRQAEGRAGAVESHAGPADTGHVERRTHDLAAELGDLLQARVQSSASRYSNQCGGTPCRLRSAPAGSLPHLRNHEGKVLNNDINVVIFSP